MAATKISALPVATTLVGTEVLPVVQAAATTAASVNQVGAFEPATVTIASVAAPAIGAALAKTVLLTGTVAVTGFDTVAAGTFRRVRFGGILTLTFNAVSLILPTGASITTAADDVAEFVSLGAGNWFCTIYARKSGAALISSGGGALVNVTETLSTSAPNATVNVEQLAVTGGTTNTDIAWQPRGTGAFQLGPAADSTTAGGNKRGASAVDLQMVRAAASQVAVGANSAVLGGANNATTGSYQVVVGGLSNNISASAHAHGVIAGGTGNTISSNGSRSAIGGGESNTIGPSTCIYSVIPGGFSNTITPFAYSSANFAYAGGRSSAAQADYAYVHGFTCTATGLNSHVRGFQALDRTITGVDVWSSINRTAQGDNQTIRGVPRATTADAATATSLLLDALGVSAVNQILLPTASGLKVRGQVLGRNTSNSDVVGFDFSALLKNVGGTVSVVGTPTVTQVFSDAGLTTTALTVGADNTNKTLKLQVNGVAATTISWSCEFTALQGA